ncbi:MAG: hypothetical protein ACFCD0_11350 [Gemmataceae bacterium]
MRNSVPESELEIEIIESCLDRFGPAPRSLDPADAKACRLDLPWEFEDLFVRKKDPMVQILDDQVLLRDRGDIVWGHIVQANRSLFDPNNANPLPANVVYSLDTYFDGRVGLLRKIAKGLFANKGSLPEDRELREFVRVITDERERLLRRELPRGYCGGRSVNFTTCFIVPDHLPGGYLAESAFPMLVNYEETEAVMVLPSRFWPYHFVKRWWK